MEEADGEEELGEGHEGLCRERGPGGAFGTEVGDEEEVDDDVEHQRGGGEDVELAEVASGGEEGSKDVGNGDGDEAEDDHAEGWYIECSAARIEEIHQWLGEEGAGHRSSHGKEDQGPEDKTSGVL